VAPGKVARLPGSGIDLDAFRPVAMPSRAGHPFRFLLVARMLRDKGVMEYVEAARIVRQHIPDVEFGLLGFVDVRNPTAISSEQMAAWVNEGVVRYLGATDDVKPHLVAADCVVLPSYREGTPRSLLEAAAVARPIITTDVVGCRDVVDDGVNGFLCRPRCADDLADKMIRMIRLSPESRTEMSMLGRRKMEREFDERIVIDRYLAAVKQVCEPARNG
jgi:glycosyltransferase involved in cell wall biosynthesis